MSDQVRRKPYAQVETPTHCDGTHPSPGRVRDPWRQPERERKPAGGERRSERRSCGQGGRDTRRALPGEIDNLDPALISDSNSSYVMNQVMEGLVGLHEGSISQIDPMLAESLPTASDDGLTYTFKLRNRRQVP